MKPVKPLTALGRLPRCRPRHGGRHRDPSPNDPMNRFLPEGKGGEMKVFENDW